MPMFKPYPNCSGAAFHVRKAVCQLCGHCKSKSLTLVVETSKSQRQTRSSQALIKVVGNRTRKKIKNVESLIKVV